MVRLDERPRRSRLIEPAGVSPVRTGNGPSGSRPPARREIAVAEAGRREPLRREQERGPQHQGKPAASTQKQCGSRAEHVTAKATFAERKSSWKLGSCSRASVPCSERASTNRTGRSRCGAGGAQSSGGAGSAGRRRGYRGSRGAGESGDPCLHEHEPAHRSKTWRVSGNRRPWPGNPAPSRKGVLLPPPSRLTMGGPKPSECI